jgi:hypothetical protein
MREESKKQKSDLDDLETRSLTAYADAIMEFVKANAFLLGFSSGFLWFFLSNVC